MISSHNCFSFVADKEPSLVPHALITTDAMCSIKLEPGLEQILVMEKKEPGVVEQQQGTELSDGEYMEEMVVVEDDEEEVGVSWYDANAPKVLQPKIQL